MDEIDWMKQFKKGFQYINLFIIGLMLFSLICGLIIYIFNPEDARLIDRLIGGVIIVIGTNIFLGITYGSIWIVNKLTNMNVDINFGKEYISELQNEYTPAIASFIYDLKTEVYRDYTAIILYLYTKKYINISEFSNDMIITKGQNENISNLTRHEQYVYNCIVYKQGLDENILKDLIICDAKGKGLIETVEERKNENKNVIRTMSILYIALIIVILICSKGNFKLIVMSLLILLATIMMIGEVFRIVNKYGDNAGKAYKLTQKGKQELKKLKSFKNFIKDYTLIEEKDIEYIQLLEEYIPYSLSLGMSPQVEEYIKKNEIYRNLIYKGRENWI